MSETLTTEQEVTTEVKAPVANPFDETSWAETPAVETPQETVEAPKETSQAPVSETKPEEEITLDPNEWLKKEFGWDTAEIAKAELVELRKLKEGAKTPAEIQLINEQRQKLLDALNEKEDEVYTYLDQKKKLQRLDGLELKGVTEASEILKASLQFKHADLTAEEVNFLYNKRYSFPAKPKQRDDQEDSDFAIELEGWQHSVKEKEQEMIIEAKLARPELAKYKSELVLPDIPKKEPETKEPELDQASLEKLQAFRDMVYQKLDNDFSGFKGFETKVKDESVELPISFLIPDEEKVAIKEQLKTFNLNDYFDARWFNDKGEPNVHQMMKDLYLLEKHEKVFQAISNNAASKRLEAKLKEASNIKINPEPQKTFTPDNGKSDYERLADQVWNTTG